MTRLQSEVQEQCAPAADAPAAKSGVTADYSLVAVVVLAVLFIIHLQTFVCFFSERARLVHPTRTQPSSIPRRRESFFVCLCARVSPDHGTAGDVIAAVSGRWRVERGLEGARSPFAWLARRRVCI